MSCFTSKKSLTLEQKTEVPLVRGLHGRVFLSKLVCSFWVPPGCTLFQVTVVFPEYTMGAVTLPCYHLAVPIQETASWGGAKPCQGGLSEQ